MDSYRVDLSSIPLRQRTWEDLGMSPLRLGKVLGLSGLRGVSEIDLQQAVFLPRTLQESLSLYSFSEETLGRLPKSVLNQPLRTEVGARTRVAVTELALKQSSPELIGDLLSEYLWTELRDLGIRWNGFPVDPVFIPSSNSPIHQDLPQLPAGFGLENANDFAQAISLNRGLSRLYWLSFRQHRIPNLEFLLSEGHSCSELIQVLLQAPNPLETLFNSEVAMNGSDYYRYLMSQLKHQLNGHGRRHLQSSSMQRLDDQFRSNSSEAALVVARATHSGRIKSQQLIGILA